MRIGGAIFGQKQLLRIRGLPIRWRVSGCAGSFGIALQRFTFTSSAVVIAWGKSESAGKRVRDGLGEELKKLRGADLLKFQAAATIAFSSVGRSSEQAAVVLSTTLQVGLDHLKVDAAKTGEAFTVAGKDILAMFQAISTNALATSKQVEEAFSAALGGLKTREEAEARKALEVAMKQGKIGADATARSMTELRARVRELSVAADPLADSFERLGIKSQRALNTVRDSAREAFEESIAAAWQRSSLRRAQRLTPKWRRERRVAAADPRQMAGLKARALAPPRSISRQPST